MVDSQSSNSLSPLEAHKQRLAKKRDRRAQWKQAGLCTRCGHERDEAGNASCSRCRAKDKANRQKNYAEYKRRKKTGTPAPSPAGTSVDMKAYKRAWRARRKASGVCTTCGGPRDIAGRVRCSACRLYEQATYGVSSRERRLQQAPQANEAMRQKRQAWIAAGKCSWCGAEKQRTTRRRCDACHDKADTTQKAIKAERRQLAVCMRCGKKRDVSDRPHCAKCLEKCRAQYRREFARNPEKYVARWQKRRAQLAALGGQFTAEEWEAIKRAHDYTCLMCGRREPEIKLSVDHVIPVSKKGPNDASNLQPLCGTCNRKKGARHIDLRSPS